LGGKKATTVNYRWDQRQLTDVSFPNGS